MRALFFATTLFLSVSLTGCQCIQQIEQWKCDNWGMCHFAQQRPGVYSPMALPPSYGVPPSGLAPMSAPAPMTYATPTYAGPAATYVGPATTAPVMATPPATAYPMSGQPIPSSNCRECQN
ncbi:MAG: hypothetical protein MUF23_05485 [Pirellula sp.]|nr:hypothetical protein [Pirellula sp.]